MIYFYGILLTPILVIVVMEVIRCFRKCKLKNLKYGWTWIVKKTKVFAVRKKQIGWDDDSWDYVYRLESKDDAWNLYSSDNFKNIEHGWYTLEEMVKNFDGVVYNLWDKDKAIKQIMDNLVHLETKLQGNKWFFKKLWLIHRIKVMQKYIEIANEWPKTPYLVRKGHKISVWDSIDVYVNPDKPSEYYFDLDFTKKN